MALERVRIARVADHSFLEAPITEASVVIDLGVNKGAFAMAMVDVYGCSVAGVEPVPHLFAALPVHDRLRVEQFAITGDGGPVTLYVNPERCATIEKGLSQSDATPVDVKGITLEGLLDRHGLEHAPLVKVDIEGAEFDMIGHASLATLQRVDQFTIEFHDFLDPSLAGRVREAKGRLRAAGFRQLSMSLDNTDVLFVNCARIRFDAVHRAAAALAYKYPRGIGRNIDRRLRPAQRG